jgi:hypothetical protein
VSEQYIWISRWEDFQHYAPKRDRGPAWIKDYTAQLSDERYLRLTDRQRALLRDLRDVFATMRGRLPDDAAMITRQRNSQTRRGDLSALNRAGFIQFLSRRSLEHRLDEFYASRAPARSQEPEPEPEAGSTTSNRTEVRPEATPTEPEIRAPRNGTLDVKNELLLARLLDWIGDDADTRTAAVIRHTLSNASEAAIVELEESLTTAKPRHRAKYVVGTLKVATARAKTAA